jgi:ABC-type transport system involved in cytochrome c biogenesis permease subunit
MKGKFLLLILGVIFLSPNFLLFAESTTLEKVAILHKGRMKPLDSAARIELLGFYNKSTIDKKQAILWLEQLLFNPEKSFKEKDFKVRTPDVLSSLGLETTEAHRYSFAELGKGFYENGELILEIQKKEKKERGLVEKQLLDLYGAVLQYQQISLSLSCFQPNIELSGNAVLKAFGLKENAKVSYFKIMKQKDELRELAKFISTKNKNYTAEEMVTLRFLLKISKMSEAHKHNDYLAIIPPVDKNDEHYLSPWQLLDGRDITEKQMALLSLIDKAVSDHLADDFESSRESITIFTEEVGYTKGIDLELKYNKFDLFYISLYFYIFALISVMLSWLLLKRFLNILALGSMIIGFVLHVIGLILRAMIMHRPPVTNLYESVIFVGVIVVLMFLVLELIRKDRIALLLGTFCGALLHFIGFSYASDGDTLGMLVAVLDSNFWLATHVVTITIGYACSFVAGLVGHVYLFIQIFYPKKKELLKNVFANSRGLLIVAIFFVVLGTILGGIWADQSWGRFWGWDPKENGALLIALWLLMTQHGRISGVFSPIVYAASLSLTNITVALAWFGVNLLNVGLHSYGFTDSIALNLAIFCGVEFIFAMMACIFAQISFRKNLKNS